MRRFIITIIAVLSVPLLAQDRIDPRAATRDAIQNMRVIVEAIELYQADLGKVPHASDIEKLRALLVPKYVRDFSTKDVRYSVEGGSYRLTANEIAVKDGVFEITVPAGDFVPWGHPSAAPLAQPTGTSPKIKQLVVQVNTQKINQTMEEIRTVAQAVEAYAVDNGHYPIANTMSDLRRLIEPRYLKHVPLLDAWQTPYWYASDQRGSEYGISSAGADLYRDPTDSPQSNETSSDPTRDAIFENQQFVRKWAPASNDRAPQRRTMANMRTLASAIAAYNVDEGHYPYAETIEDLAKMVEPKYVKYMPRTDAWGTPFRYVASSRGPKTYVLVSAGSDRTFDEKTWPMRGDNIEDSAEDAVMMADGFTRQWATRTAMEWSVGILQNGVVVPAHDGIVTIDRAPFTIRVTLPEERTVELNAWTDDRVARRMEPGFDFRSCRTHIVAFCPATGMAEEDGNPRKLLFLREDAMHYITEERWNHTSKTPRAIVYDRDVAMLGDLPIEATGMPELYLTFIVRSGDSTVLGADEVRKIHLLVR